MTYGRNKNKLCTFKFNLCIIYDDYITLVNGINGAKTFLNVINSIHLSEVYGCTKY